MFGATSEDQEYLRKSIEIGEAILVLGAGASATSRNDVGLPVAMAPRLAEILARRAGIPYRSESLTAVLTAVEGTVLSKTQITQILKGEYLNISPAIELEHIFQFPWKRVYTWNIDDSLENIPLQRPQKRRHYNGLVDKVVDFEGPATLHVVHLHGQITKPDHGFILSETDYTQAIITSRHNWYKRAAQDYIAFCPVFIGTTLNEPILAAELERARRQLNGAAGHAFLITPENLTPIQSKGLEAKGIRHLKGSAADFSRWLGIKFPKGLTSRDVSTHHSISIDVERLTTEDINTAHSLRPIRAAELIGNVRRLAPMELEMLGRRFLQGFPPSWQIAASEIPALLESSDGLYRSLAQTIERSDKLFLVRGQSGAGKSTAVMMALLKYLKEHTDVLLYEVAADVKSIRSVFELIRKIHENKRCILFVADMFLFSDGLKADLERLSGGQITVVSTARSSEWAEQFRRIFGSVCRPYEHPRFSERDYDPLIDRLLRFVPAPNFRRLEREDQRKALARSRNQLLIALREVTDSTIFSDIITNEFERLPDQDTQRLFAIVGLSTIARVGISAEAAREAYEEVSSKRSFDNALSALDGIVNLTEKRRLVARHELYARHVIEQLLPFSEICTAIVAILRTYTKYSIPVIKFVSRQDSHLFKTLLGHRFISFHAKKWNSQAEGGVKIYEEFEVDFQLDGHFWLQYGLYLADIDRLEEAITVLRKSIQAYPANEFAVHAHAMLQLRAAEQRNLYDTITEQLIGDAVETLKLQDARTYLELDVYPIVTLALGHVGALVKHQQIEAARRAAPQYFERLQQVSRQVSDRSVEEARDKILKFTATGEWAGRIYVN